MSYTRPLWQCKHSIYRVSTNYSLDLIWKEYLFVRLTFFSFLDLHRMSKNTNQETEAYNNHLAFSQTLLADQYKCTKFAEHNLIHWTSGDPPGYVPEATTSTIANLSDIGEIEIKKYSYWIGLKSILNIFPQNSVKTLLKKCVFYFWSRYTKYLRHPT